ncbi:MAG: prepilin-type N-terminal cleavage/methylation domain-containing protein [Deltaproteobacteria bacterium]|nr:prepilin-type N-terminal cleavage/methylation domain-containing protein [Deltaproteobacteria bacterium]
MSAPPIASLVSPAKRDSNAGYTLLEVMVAIAILALALTAIFSSEAGAIRAGTRARKQTTGVLLARCKMNEIEAHLEQDGFPAVEETGSDGCCEDAETAGYTCDWKVERVELPEPAELTEEGEGEAAGAAAGGEPPAETPDVNALLSGDPSAAEAALGGGGICEMGFQMAYPVLRPVLVEVVRRVSVTVRWREGSRERSFDVVQYVVTNPSPPAPPPP